MDHISELLNESGLANLSWQHPIMWLIGGIFIFLAVKKDIEPLLLLPIGFAVIVVNMPLGGLTDDPAAGHIPGLFFMLNEFGLKTDLIPLLIFLGLGAMTDFGPLISNPKTLLLGAAAQLGVFIAFLGALLFGFTLQEASAIGIIGGADGPTTIYTASTLKVQDAVLGACAISAYSYMALVPIIQPPIIKALTSKQERGITMSQLRPVGRIQKVLFPTIGGAAICLLVPKATPLVSMFMLGNLFTVSKVVDRLKDAAQNALMNIVTIFLGLAVGSTMVGAQFLTWEVIGIYVLGLVAFCFSTAGGILFAKLMNLFLKTKINPLLGSAGVSAVPMAARVSHKLGSEANPKCYILMHAMGPNVAGVIGTMVAASILITLTDPSHARDAPVVAPAVTDVRAQPGEEAAPPAPEAPPRSGCGCPRCRRDAPCAGRPPAHNIRGPEPSASEASREREDPTRLEPGRSPGALPAAPP